MTCVLYARAAYLLANKEDGLPLAVDSPALVPYINRLYVNRSNSYFFVLGAEGRVACRAVAHCFPSEPVDTSRVLYISGFPAHTRQDELLSHLRCVVRFSFTKSNADFVLGSLAPFGSLGWTRCLLLSRITHPLFGSIVSLRSARVESIAHVREVLRKFAGLCNLLVGCCFFLTFICHSSTIPCCGHGNLSRLVRQSRRCCHLWRSQASPVSWC
jgi:hypothetical protein